MCSFFPFMDFFSFLSPFYVRDDSLQSLEMKMPLLHDHEGRLRRLCRRQRFRLYWHVWRTSWEKKTLFKSFHWVLLCWIVLHSADQAITVKALKWIWLSSEWHNFKKKKRRFLSELFHIFLFYNLLHWLQSLTYWHFSKFEFSQPQWMRNILHFFWQTNKSLVIIGLYSMSFSFLIFFPEWKKWLSFCQLAQWWCCIMEETSLHVQASIHKLFSWMSNCHTDLDMYILFKISH